jgi:hypothetical protein
MSPVSVPKRQLPLGTPYFVDAKGIGDPGIDKVILTDTVLSGTRNLTQIIVTCRMEGVFNILAGSQVIGSGRTSAAAPNVPFGFDPWRPLPSSTILKVIFRQRDKSPPASVEVYLQALNV